MSYGKGALGVVGGKARVRVAAGEGLELQVSAQVPQRKVDLFTSEDPSLAVLTTATKQERPHDHRTPRS
jgi:hypothetical protein